MIPKCDVWGGRPVLCCRGWGFWSWANQLTVTWNCDRGGRGVVLNTFNCIQTHARVQSGEKKKVLVAVGGQGCHYKKGTTKTRWVCGPWNPAAWYTAPLKLAAVFIAALEISLVKLAGLTRKPGAACCSQPPTGQPQKPTEGDLAGSGRAGSRLWVRTEGYVWERILTVYTSSVKQSSTRCTSSFFKCKYRGHIYVSFSYKNRHFKWYNHYWPRTSVHLLLMPLYAHLFL